MLEVEVEVRVIGRRTTALEPRRVAIDLAPGAVMLREFIPAVVRSEVAASRERAANRPVLRALTDSALADGVEVGKVTAGGVEDIDHVDERAAITAALLAHEDGLYEVVIDDEPIASLEDVVQISARTSVMFIRLVALRGG